MGRVDNENLGIAFGLVIGAGAATGLGAAVVFIPALVKLASRRTLAAALGLSAGVMTYVSFVEIFAKSTSAFEDAGFSEDDAYIYGTLCFFAGVILMVVRFFQGGMHDSKLGSIFDHSQMFSRFSPSLLPLHSCLIKQLRGSWVDTIIITITLTRTNIGGPRAENRPCPEITMRTTQQRIQRI
jgi:zinc transporter ZupT